MLLMIAPMLVAAAATPAADANPIQPALAGQLQCHVPNEQTKTCRSIASYKPLGGNRYSNTATVLLAPDGPVTLEVTSEVEVKNGAVCGLLRKEDFDAGRLSVGGRVLDPSQAAPGIAQIEGAMASLLGKEICSTYAASASGLVAKVTVDGTARPEFDQPIKWVAPSDGYKVAP